MADHDYKCTNCGADTKRDLLTVKKVLFTEMGAGSKTIRARVVDWLCPPCVKNDPAWRAPAHQLPQYQPDGVTVSG
jgi:predicted RNA-binding Zn-ribbon protein involved in translation (DUF1610 family)